jgi:YggT family protein
MGFFAFIVYQLISFYVLIIFVTVIVGWLIGFNVINRHNRAVDWIWRTGTALTEPVLAPVRRLLPSMGGVDISPIIVVIVLQAVNIYFVRPLM